VSLDKATNYEGVFRISLFGNTIEDIKIHMDL